MERLRSIAFRIAVAAPSIVAVLSFVTGIVALAVGAGEAAPTGVIAPLVPEAGPLAPYVPAAVRRTAAFTGTLTGFLMLVSSYGLRRGLRPAWYATVVLLPLTAAQGILLTTVLSIPLVGLSLGSIPFVLLSRGRFTRSFELSTSQLAALGALVGSLLYGTTGSWVLRDEFGIETVVDAVYFAIVSASTVGYGDVTPAADAPTARLFTISYLVLGTASFAVALGTLLGPAIEARFQRVLGTMTDDELTLLDDHHLVVGASDLTEPILEELATAPFVVITRDAERAALFRERGHKVLVADPSDEEPLQRAGIGRARAMLVATDDDAQDALAILTARELNPDLRIVAAATDRENIKKLRRAGADEVISPAVIGGHLLVRSAIGEENAEETEKRVLADRVDREGDAADN